MFVSSAKLFITTSGYYFNFIIESQVCLTKHPIHSNVIYRKVDQQTRPPLNPVDLQYLLSFKPGPLD